jgi:dual-specificity kinase
MPTAPHPLHRPGSNPNYDSASYPQASMVPYRGDNHTASSWRACSQARPQAGFFAPSIPSTERYDNEEPAPPNRSGLSYADMPPVHSHPPITPADSQPPQRKRRRSRGPNWEAFYKNGLPGEIIVIDSSPEMESSTKPGVRNNPPARTLPPPVASNPAGNGVRVVDYNTIAPGAGVASVHHVAKKRRRDCEYTHYDPVYHNIYAGSHTPHLITHRASRPSQATAQLRQCTRRLPPLWRVCLPPPAPHKTITM